MWPLLALSTHGPFPFVALVPSVLSRRPNRRNVSNQTESLFQNTKVQKMDNDILHDASDLIPNLTADERKEILEDLTQHPAEAVAAASSPEDEAHGNLTTYYFGVFQLAGKWCVYSCEEGEHDLDFGGSFNDRKEALSRAKAWADETVKAAVDWLDEQKDDEWARSAEVCSSLEAPFCFSDNTDYVRGWDLENEDEVFDFFRRNDYLLLPDEWGDLYSPGLEDSNGKACWVARSHRGEMRLIEV